MLWCIEAQLNTVEQEGIRRPLVSLGSFYDSFLVVPNGWVVRRIRLRAGRKELGCCEQLSDEKFPGDNVLETKITGPNPTRP